MLDHASNNDEYKEHNNAAEFRMLLDFGDEINHIIYAIYYDTVKYERDGRGGKLSWQWIPAYLPKQRGQRSGLSFKAKPAL